MDKTQLLSKLLDLHLSRSIDRAAKRDEVDMADAPLSKARQAAQMVAERKRRMDERAQALIDRMPGFDSRLNQAFEAHEGSLDAGEADFDAMLKEVEDIERSNSKNGEGSGDTSEADFPKD
jgi:hypothetical protein